MIAAVLTLHQILLMLTLLSVGAICARLGWFDEQIAQALSKFLLWFVTPALLLDAFNQPFRTDMAYGLLLSGMLAVLFHIMAAILAQLLIRPRHFTQCAIARMGADYSNCDFMAFPLISAVLGTDGVFYGSAFVGVFNLFLWTHGRRLLVGRERFHLKNAVCNAGVLGTLVGAVLYLFFHFQFPSLAADFISTLASLNTPLAMLLIGIFLSQCQLKDLLCRNVILPVLLRVSVLPLTFLFLLLCLHVPAWHSAGPTLLMVTLLCASCPAAASTVLMTSSLGMDSSYGARLVLMSSLLSVLTIPGISLLASWLIQ